MGNFIGKAIAKADLFGSRTEFLDMTTRTAIISADLNVGPFGEIDNAIGGSNEKVTIVLERFRDAFKEAALKAAELQNPEAENAFDRVATLAQEAIDQINQPEINRPELILIKTALLRAIGICLMWKSPSSLRSLANL